MVAPHPDSLAFHHKPVNGEAAAMSMLNVCAWLRGGASNTDTNASADTLARSIFLKRFQLVLVGAVDICMIPVPYQVSYPEI